MSRIQGIVMDLDGTLVHSPLNFDSIRRELGIKSGEGILEAIDRMTEDSAKQTHERLADFEWQAARGSKRIEGVWEFFQEARSRDQFLGVFTRNSRPIAEFILKENGLEVDVLVAREDAPPKPDPVGLLKICDLWGLSREEVIYIGDYLYDVEAGERAQIETWLFSPAQKPNYHHRAHRVFSSYEELSRLAW